MHQCPRKNREALFRHLRRQEDLHERSIQSIDASECTQPVDNRCAAKVVFGKSRGNGGQEMDEDWKRYYVVLWIESENRIGDVQSDTIRCHS